MKKQKEQSVTGKAKVPDQFLEELLAAIDREIPGEFVQRHLLNKVSPSFPYNHRSLANRDSLGTGPREKATVGKHVVYRKSSLLELLRADLS